MMDTLQNILIGFLGAFVIVLQLRLNDHSKWLKHHGEWLGENSDLFLRFVKIFVKKDDDPELAQATTNEMGARSKAGVSE